MPGKAATEESGAQKHQDTTIQDRTDLSIKCISFGNLRLPCIGWEPSYCKTDKSEKDFS